MIIVHDNKDIQRQMQDLYDYTRNSTDPKAVKKVKVKQMKTALRNVGVLSLPFTINSKKF